MAEPSRHVRVEYFAILREQAGKTGEVVETSSVTARQLYDELKHRYAFSLLNEHIGVAINDDFREWDTKLNENDKVVFIPPVAGG